MLALTEASNHRTLNQLEVSASYLASAKYTVSIVANLLQSGSLYTSLEWGWVTFRRGRYDGFWVVLQQCMQYVAYSCLFSILPTCFCVSIWSTPPQLRTTGALRSNGRRRWARSPKVRAIGEWTRFARCLERSIPSQEICGFQIVVLLCDDLIAYDLLEKSWEIQLISDNKNKRWQWVAMDDHGPTLENCSTLCSVAASLFTNYTFYHTNRHWGKC